MSSTTIVKEILDKNGKDVDEKSLLDSLYNLILSQQQQSQQYMQQKNESFKQEELHKKLEEIFLSSSLYTLSTLDKPILVVNKINISNFLNYDIELIKNFMKWIYDRHYAWTEKLSSSDQSQQPFNIDPTYEQNVIHLLENITAWIENHDHLSYNLLQGFKHVISSSQSLPVVRKQSILSFCRWIKILSSKIVIVVWKCFLLLKEIILLGLTDVWSAIRKDTASKLSVIIDLLDEDMLENLFFSLIQICDKGEPWQSTEGAARGIDKILCCCKLTSTIKGKNKRIKLGRVYFDSLPSFMKDNLEKVFFKLFAHQQLSVREIAGKGFSSFLYKSEYKYFIESFEKVISYLKQNFTRKNSDNHIRFMNAYEAEGFLNALLFLIKSIPLAHIAASWPEYWTVFSHYLMHHASTVRQTTSLIFKYILAKHQTSLSFLKLVLQSLCASWKTEIEKLVKPIHTSYDNVKKERPSITSKKERNDLSVCWEWREGRLLTYEVILRYLITNNTYYMLSRVNFNNQSSRTWIPLNKSVNDGQLLGNGFGLHKQISLLQLDSHPYSKRKLAKSLTQSNMTIASEDLQKMMNSEQNLSLLQNFRKDESKESKTELLVEMISPLELREMSGYQQVDKQNKEQYIFNWLDGQEYVPFHRLIKQMLTQTIESLEDQRWELRRMSLQLLLCLSDVIRCYDYGIMEELYSEAFKHPDSPLCYGACQCFLINMKVYIKNKRVLAESPSKYLEERLKHMRETNKAFDNQSHLVLQNVSSVLPNCSHKETCNVIIQSLMLYQLYVKNTNDNEDEEVTNGTICTYLQKLYLITQERQFVVKSPQKSTNKQMLDLLCELQPNLLEYCHKTQFIYTILLLPTFFQSISLSLTGSLDVHLILNCVEAVLNKLKTKDASNYQNVLRWGCSELCNVIEKDDLESAFLHQITSIVLQLRDVMKSHFPQEKIKESVQRRLNCAEKHLANEGEKEFFTPKALDRNHKESMSGDRLSFSSASFDSARCLTEPSSSDDDSSEDGNEKEKPGHEVDMEDLSSDWDWSSADEEQRNENLVFDILGNLQKKLDYSPAPEIALTEH